MACDWVGYVLAMRVLSWENAFCSSNCNGFKPDERRSASLDCKDHPIYHGSAHIILLGGMPVPRLPPIESKLKEEVAQEPHIEEPPSQHIDSYVFRAANITRKSIEA